MIPTNPTSIAATLPSDVLAQAFQDRIGVDLFTTSAVANHIGRSNERVGQMIRSGALPGIHITLNGRGAYLVRAEDVATLTETAVA